MESERFKLRSVELVAKNALDDVSLAQLVSEQRDVMILRDAQARVEYVSSSRLTRL